MSLHRSEKKHLSAKGLLEKVGQIFEKVPEPSKDTRGLKQIIPIVDCLMSELAIFGLKFPLFFNLIREKDFCSKRV